MVVHTSWIDKANCLSADPEDFFPERGGNYQTEEVQRKYCDLCRVQAECFEYAMSYEESTPGYHTYGIYGGVGPASRKDIKNQRRKRRAPSR